MTGALKVLVALDSGVDPDRVRQSLPDDAAVAIVGLVEGLEEAWTTLQEVPTDVLIVAAAGYSERALFLIEGAIKQQQDRPVVVLSELSPNGFIDRVFEAGADDFLTLPESPEHVGFALEKAVARKRGSVTSGVALAPMICVLGPKGGTGKTLTSCNLGVALATAGKRVVLVDLDLQFGDVGLSLGLAPDVTVYELAKSGGSLDAEKIDAYMAEHESGLRVLLAPTRPDHAALVTVEFLREVYATLRASYDYVIVDTPPGFTPEVIASIDSSSNVCMVAMLDALSLKNTKLGLETLQLMGYDSGRITLVLNRADTRVGISDDDVAAIIGRLPDVEVPSDRDIPRAVNESTPIVLADPRCEAARAFNALAELYIAKAAPPSAQADNGNGKQGSAKPTALQRLIARSG
jgi:pilus assembly protein CpaE